LSYCERGASDEQTLTSLRPASTDLSQLNRIIDESLKAAQEKAKEDGYVKLERGFGVSRARLSRCETDDAD
jgi:hypothetical protein